MARCATRADDLEALTEVAHREREALVRTARREGVGAQDALECVQDAVCTFLARYRRGEVEAPEADWGYVLAAMAKNAARNRRRSHALARPHQELDESQVPAVAAPAADELAIHAESHVRLRACVAELCGVQRAVVLLRLLDERPGEDVARSLGISRGYVDVLTHRAKNALRACMMRAEG